jgi:tetratricopeptide (TPR) repeat protein
MGVNFFVMSKEDRREWDRFCLELERKPHYREHVERTGVGPAPVRREAAPETVSPPQATAASPSAMALASDDDSLSLGTGPRLEDLSGLEELEDLDADDEVEVPLVAAAPADDLDDLDVTFVADDIEVTVLYDELDDPEAEAGVRISDEVSLDPGSPHTHTALGRVLLEQMEDAGAAVEALQRALECDPDYLEAHLLLRLAYALLGQRERALEHLRIARRLQAGPVSDAP